MDFNAYFNKVIQNLAKDNNMPFVKTEVVYDTFLYPEVLEKLLKKADIEAKYITKEFPIDNKSLGLNKGYISADYFLVNHEKKKFYIVELKTTNKSFNYEQLQRYTVLMGSFNDILNRYITKEYAKDVAYDKQRDEVKKGLLGFDRDQDMSRFRGYEVCLVYIIPGFKDCESIQDKVKDVVKSKAKSLESYQKSKGCLKAKVDQKTKNLKFYEELEKSLEGKEIKTISINDLVYSKLNSSSWDISSKEMDELDQFLFIWYATMMPFEIL